MTQQVSSAATSWVVDAARTKSGDFEYYPNSQLKKITRLQGSNTTALITDYKQNAPDDHWVPGRISKVEHSGLASGTQITSNDFDVSGRIIQKVTPAQTYNYAYDGTDQLTTVTNAGGATLQDPNFNAVGNDTGHTVSYYNRVLNDGTYSYVYNNEGSRTRRTKTSDGSYETYTYDHRQRLTAVATFTVANVKTKEVKYEYDALDRRFRRRLDANGDGDFIDAGDTRERLLYDTNPVNPEFGEVVQIIDDTNGNRQHRFLNGPQPDMILTDEVFNGTGTPNDILWLLQDHQNSVTDVATIPTSGSAILRNHLEYNAFGQITSQTDATYAPVQTYTGQILDTATGLLYYDARWYDPQLGRFVAVDPSGFAAGDANLSRYVGNSWPNANDPTGTEWYNPFTWFSGPEDADAESVAMHDALLRQFNARNKSNFRSLEDIPDSQFRSHFGRSRPAGSLDPRRLHRESTGRMIATYDNSETCLFVAAAADGAAAVAIAAPFVAAGSETAGTAVYSRDLSTIHPIDRNAVGS